MIEDPQPRQRNRKRLWLILAALAALLAILIVPPFLSVSRYKASITRLISTSLGRPVRLSSVEVRLLPRPGFVLTDLTVEDDPAYGAEPVLHANTVTASIRLLSLWRGRLELDTISVDEASLNLVRTPLGRWNIDPLLRTASVQAQSASGESTAGKAVKLPYLEATNSRINIKDGVEKLPYSLLNAEMSLWQESAGDWRVRLRAQPVRTDLSIEEADTGVVRLEAEFHQAPQLRQMPTHLDLEWREAQLGQLTRLLLGADAGWRGDLTGELHLDGTAEAAQIRTRLRASRVHRAEFAPAAPMDFDANCTMVAHFTVRAIDNMVCDSPFGDGHVHLTGNLSGGQSSSGASPGISVEMDRIPVALGLDALRTVRSGLSPNLKVAGTVSGKLTYAPVAAVAAALPQLPLHSARARQAKTPPPPPGPLTGSLTVQGFELSGSGLSQPIVIPKLLLEPAPATVNPSQDSSSALVAAVALPAGAPTPLSITMRLAASGYQATVRGQASIARAKELAHVAGLGDGLDALAGEAITVDLTAGGPWMPPPPNPLASGGFVETGSQSLRSFFGPGYSFAGVVTLRNANWKADYLTNALLISQATLHLSPEQLRWDPIVFSYGPVKGTAILIFPAACGESQSCSPYFQLQFGALDAAVLQAALLGAHEKGTLISTLLERLRPTASPVWPRLEGTVKAESLLLGPVTLHNFTATLSTIPDGATIPAFNAILFGGLVQGSGTYRRAASATDKPAYELEGQLTGLNPPALGQLIGLRTSGGLFDGNGKIALSGFTSGDLAASAKGSLHFEWQHGSIAAASGFLPPALARFDRWSADAVINNGAFTLNENQVKLGLRSQSVQASIPLAIPPKIDFAASKPLPARR
ncbi:MAG: AsmA family protein [Terracidiphilus sp.]